MCKHDYIESSALIDGNCHKRCNRVVMGQCMKLECSIDDQTIIDNCQISKTRINTLKASMAVIRSSRLEQ